MKKWYFRERNYRTLRETVIPTKKAPQKVLIINGARYCVIIGLKIIRILKICIINSNLFENLKIMKYCCYIKFLEYSND